MVAAPVVREKLVSVTVVVVPPDWSGLLAAKFVMLWKSHTHPVVAAGMVMVPIEVAQAVPTLIVNAPVPLLLGIVGEVQNVVATGAVDEYITAVGTITPPAAFVARASADPTPAPRPVTLAIATEIAELQPKPVLVVQINALNDVLHEPMVNAVGAADPAVALPTIVLVVCVASELNAIFERWMSSATASRRKMLL